MIRWNVRNVCRQAGFLALVLALAGTALSAEPEALVTAPGGVLELTPPASGLVVEAALDGGILQPVPGGRLTAPAEGVHWLAVRTRDALGTGSAVRWIRLEVDGRSPEIRLVVEPEPVAVDGRSWVPTNAVVYLEAEDRPAGLAEATLRAGGRVADGSDSLVVSEEGPVTVRAEARDRVGNEGSARIELTVDGTPPEVRLEPGSPSVSVEGRSIVAPSTPFELAVDDRGSGVASTAVSVDGHEAGRESLAGPWSPGAHRIEIRAVDRVGNASAPLTVRFTVDDRPPAIRCAIEGAAEATAGDRTWYRPPVEVQCTAEDALAGVDRVERRVNGVWIPLEGDVSLQDGKLEVRAVDRLGNEAAKVFRWPVDGEPPRLAVRLPGGAVAPPGGPAGLHQGEALVPEAADSGCGQVTVRYRIGGGPWMPLEGGIRFRHSGSYDLALRACDGLGNCTEASWPVTIERGGV